jgi:hypothetical protein
MVHGLFGSVGTTPFTIRTSAKTHSLLALTMIDPDTGWFEFVKATNKSATYIQDLFHNLVGTLPATMGECMISKGSRKFVTNTV